MKEVKETGAKKDNIYKVNGTKNNNYVPLENKKRYTQGKRKAKEKYPFSKRMKKDIWIIVSICVLSLILYSEIDTNTSVNTSKEAKQAIKTHISTTLAAGTKIMSADQKFAGKDVTVKHTSPGGVLKMYVWDYAAEDGDYVEILVDGEPICEPFMIRNEAREFSVPAVCKVQINGIKDGGEGITYGVYFDVNEKTYYNCTVVGGSNVYILKGR